VVVGVQEERDDMRVSELAELVELLPECAQPLLTAAAAVRLHGDRHAVPKHVDVDGTRAGTLTPLLRLGRVSMVGWRI
jgi:hypothetical protein